MEKCLSCKSESPPGTSTGVCPLGKFIGVVCWSCRDVILTEYIADQEAERKKAKPPTLEERVARYIADNNIHGMDTPQNEQAETIITLVREHDTTALKPTTPADVLQLRVEVLDRSLKERTAELNIARESIAKLTDKLNRVRTDLAYD